MATTPRKPTKADPLADQPAGEQPARIPPLRKNYQAPPVGQDKRPAARKIKPEQASPDRGAERIADANGMEMSIDEAKERVRGILEATVSQRIREAQAARESAGIEEIWAEDEDQYNGIDWMNQPSGVVKTRDQWSKSSKPSKRSKVVLNITKPKTDTAVARVQEMLLPHDDKPWEIKPTPMPELDGADDLPEDTLIQIGDGNMVPARAVAGALKDKAQAKSDKMAQWVEDKFVEGSVYAEMRKVIRDAGRLGSGCIKGPITVSKTIKKWSIIDKQTAVLQITQKLSHTSRRIRIQDAYPAPDCGDSLHDGSYFVERDHLTARKLRDLADLPDYDRTAIAKALDEGPRRTGQFRTRNRVDTPGDTFVDAEMFEVFYYYGDVTPADLILLGVDNGKPEGESTLTEEEMLMPALPAIVTMLNGRAIKATINPDETGEFPYDIFTWEPIDGQPWGRGIPRKMAVPARGLNSSVRALLENAGLSAGAQIVYANGAVEPVDREYEISGRKLWSFTPNDVIDDIRKAFSVTNIPSVQKELSAIIQFWLDMADVLTNLPMLMQGMQQAGTSPDTLGGMKMLLNNSTAPLRVIAKQFDDQLVIPHLRRYNNAGMQDPDCPAEAKGDHQIAAKGATALVQREEGVEFLAMLYPVKDDPKLKIDPAKFVREMARSRGFNMETIQYSADDQKRIDEELANQPPPVEPVVQAAQIRSQALMETTQAKVADAEAERRFKSEENEADRQAAATLAAVEKEIEMMRLAGNENISLAEIKAMLASKAMDNRVKTDEMRLKLAPANPTNEGI